MMHDWGYGNSYGYGGADWLVMFLMMVLVVFLIIVAVRYFGRDGHHHSQGETAMDVLKKRYAKGEIDKKEFDEKRKDLE